MELLGKPIAFERWRVENGMLDRIVRMARAETSQIPMKKVQHAGDKNFWNDLNSIELLLLG